MEHEFGVAGLQSIKLLRHERSNQRSLDLIAGELAQMGIALEDLGSYADMAALDPAAEDFYLADVRLRGGGTQANSGRLEPCYNRRFENRIVWFCDDEGLQLVAGCDMEQIRGEFFLVSPYSVPQMQRCLTGAVAFFRHRHACMVNTVLTADFILAHMHEGILVTDGDQTLSYVNQKMADLLGQPVLRLLYANIDDVLHVVEVEAPESSAKDRSGPGEGEGASEWCKLIQADGNRIPVEKWELPLLQPNGRRVGTLIGIRDNSGEQEYIRRMERAKLQAEQAAHAKNEFLANISHELRTPLNGILGMTELALDMARNKEQEEYLRILKVSAESLYSLISSMLDYIKLESGTFSIRERAFQLADTVETISANFAIHCHSKHLGFHVAIDPAIYASYIGDETRIVQICSNLLSNALKFTDRGEVVLSLREGEAPRHELSEKYYDYRPLEITVRDSGIGIPADRLWDIFQPFTQIEQTLNRNLSGTGIGLTITKMLVEAMGGKIRAKSELGRGSEFSCTVWIKPGGQRRILDSHGFMTKRLAFVLVADSPGWGQAILPWLLQFGFPARLCGSADAFADAVAEFGAADCVCVFQGSLAFADEALDLARRDPALAGLQRTRHIVTLRIPREEECRWQSAPFAFSILFEPVRPSSLYSLIKELVIERNSSAATAKAESFVSHYHLRILFSEEGGGGQGGLAGLLSAAGHLPRAAPDGKALLDILRDEEFDLVIVDIHMPELNGYEAMSMIRSGGLGARVRHIPAIALTASHSMHDRRHAEMLALNAILSKPYSDQALLMVVDRVWEQELGGNSYIQRGRLSGNLSLANDILADITEKQWENATKKTQELRKLYADVDAGEEAELSFRLLLAIRRRESEAALHIIDALLQQKGD